MPEQRYVEGRSGRMIRCPEGYSYGFSLSGKFPPTLEEILRWCRGSFGRGGGYRRWTCEHNTVFFRFETDAFAYKMRWL